MYFCRSYSFIHVSWLLAYYILLYHFFIHMTSKSQIYIILKMEIGTVYYQVRKLSICRLFLGPIPPALNRGENKVRWPHLYSWSRPGVLKGKCMLVNTSFAATDKSVWKSLFYPFLWMLLPRSWIIFWFYVFLCWILFHFIIYIVFHSSFF